MVLGKHTHKYSTQMNVIRCEDIKEEDNKQQSVEEEIKQNPYLGQVTEEQFGQGTMNFVMNETQEKMSPLLLKAEHNTKSTFNIDVSATNDNLPFINANGAEEIGRFSNKQKKDNKLKIIAALQQR